MKKRIPLILIFIISILLHVSLLKSWKDESKKASDPKGGVEKSEKSSKEKAQAAAMTKALADAKAKAEALKKKENELKKKNNQKKSTPKLPPLKGDSKPVQTTSNDPKLEENNGSNPPPENNAKVTQAQVTQVREQLKEETEKLQRLEDLVAKSKKKQIIKLRIVDQDPNKKSAFYLSLKNAQENQELEDKQQELEEKKKKLENLKRDFEKKEKSLKDKKELEKIKKELADKKKKLELKNKELEEKKKKLELKRQKELADKKKKELQKKNDLATKKENLRKAQKVTIKSKISKSQHTAYLRSMKVGRMKGVPVPKLIQTYRDTAELLAVHRYYGMKIIAYRLSAPRDVIIVEGIGSGQVHYQKINNFNFQNYGSRHFPRSSAFFQKYHRHIQSNELLGKGDIRLVSIIPSGVDSYFRYKQMEVIKRNNYNADDVSEVLSSFQKTSFGAWILKIEDIQLRDGESLSVEDFEYQKIIGN